MGSEIVNLLVLMAVGVIIADMIAGSNVTGTKTLFCNLGNIWQIGISGMLGQQAKTTQC